LREAEDLFSFQKLLLGRVIEFGFRGAWRLTRLLRYRQDAEQRDGQERTD
jgi:hypothetical protein